MHRRLAAERSRFLGAQVDKLNVAPVRTRPARQTISLSGMPASTSAKVAALIPAHSRPPSSASTKTDISIRDLE